MTNYVLLRSVTFGAGAGETGCTFASSEQDRPAGQFYHYRQTVNDGTQSSIEITENGCTVPNTLRQRFDLDVRIVAASHEGLSRTARHHSAGGMGRVCSAGGFEIGGRSGP